MGSKKLDNNWHCRTLPKSIPSASKPNKKGSYRKNISCWWARANFHLFLGWIVKESIEVGQPTP